MYKLAATPVYNGTKYSVLFDSHKEHALRSKALAKVWAEQFKSAVSQIRHQIIYTIYWKCQYLNMGYAKETIARALTDELPEVRSKAGECLYRLRAHEAQLLVPLLQKSFDNGITAAPRRRNA